MQKEKKSWDALSGKQWRDQLRWSIWRSEKSGKSNRLFDFIWLRYLITLDVAEFLHSNDGDLKEYYSINEQQDDAGNDHEYYRSYKQYHAAKDWKSYRSYRRRTQLENEQQER